MIRVLVVDDHPIMRLGIASIIRVQSDMQVVADAGTGEEAVALFDKFQPDITLMDLQLPGMSGVQAIQKIRDRYRDARFVVLTTYKGDEDIFQALRAGAAGYLIKGMSPEPLLDALRRVHNGKTYIPQELSSTLKDRTAHAELSIREREVLSLIAAGHSNKSIAEKLNITEGTVKCHVSAILAQLQVEDRTRALVVAIQRGFIHP